MTTHYIPIDGDPDRVIVYRPQAGVAFVGNRALERLIQARSEGRIGTIDDDIDAFLAGLDFWREDAPYVDPAEQAFTPATAVLLLTNQCNLRCSYCYADAGTRPRRELDLTHAIQAIDYVFAQAIDQQTGMFRVDFHGGGEPTAAWSLLRACTAHARAKPLPARISLTYNAGRRPSATGSLPISTKPLSISVDGRPAIQNRNRPLPNGGGSADCVRQSPRAGRDGRHYGVRITATAPWEALDEDVAYLCRHEGCHTIQVEPSFNTVRGGHNAIPDPEDAAALPVHSWPLRSRTQPGPACVLFRRAPRRDRPDVLQCPYMALIVGPGGLFTTCYEVTRKTILCSISRTSAASARTACRSTWHAAAGCISGCPNAAPRAKAASAGHLRRPESTRAPSRPARKAI